MTRVHPALQKKPIRRIQDAHCVSCLRRNLLHAALVLAMVLMQALAHRLTTARALLALDLCGVTFPQSYDHNWRPRWW